MFKVWNLLVFVCHITSGRWQRSTLKSSTKHHLFPCHFEFCSSKRSSNFVILNMVPTKQFRTLSFRILYPIPITSTERVIKAKLNLLLCTFRRTFFISIYFEDCWELKSEKGSRKKTRREDFDLNVWCVLHFWSVWSYPNKFRKYNMYFLRTLVNFFRTIQNWMTHTVRSGNRTPTN